MTSWKIGTGRQASIALVFAVSVMAWFSAGEASAAENSTPRERLLLDAGWKFHLGDQWGTGEELAKAGSSTGPAKREFADTKWRTVNLPHDWAIELPFDRNSDTSHGFKPVGPGFPGNSVGWYRRAFTLPKEDEGKRLWLEFDGAFRDCRVFVNGYFIGHHESGYSGFRYDITDVANCGGKNTVAVRVDASQFEGWFYEGAGLYRHVWLVKTAPLAIAPDGIFVFAEFKNNVPEGAAKIHLQARLHNLKKTPAEALVRWQLFAPDGQLAGQARQAAKLPAQTELNVEQTASLTAPRLWSPEAPALYRLVTTIESDGHVVDQTETEFGVRTVAFDANRGFLLNGKPYVLKGTCNHQDHAGVGAALPDKLQYFRVARLKEMGDNAYRTSHNAPTPELLEACDHLGMLVMDENRLLGSDAANLDRLERQIRRDRNHPSVVVWSIANEEGVQETAAAGRIAETMQSLAHRLDPTRKVTKAAHNGNVFSGINAIIDVRGWNYHIGRDMDAYHAAHPAQPNVGTEQASTVSTRGIYANDKERGYVSAYDDNAPSWAHTAETWWTFFAARPWLSGAFAWTGFDYRGEPTPYAWPCINSHFGILDMCGFPKDNFYYYQAWWSDRTVLHLLPHWNWPGKEGQEIDVRCLSNCEEVELLLNGASLGKKTMRRNSHLAWKVRYAPGVLSAKGYKAGQVIAEEKVETTGDPAALKLKAESGPTKADGEDVSVITVAVVDAQGRTVPTAGNLVKFDVSGPGNMLGVGNGDPSSHEPDVYLAQPAVRSVALKDWRMKQVSSARDCAETAETVDDAAWSRADTGKDAGPLESGQSAVFRTRFSLTEADLKATSISLAFGMIDDDGWVYVNGKLAGESHDWNASPAFEIGKLLRPGENTLAVAVKNNDGPGGLNKGVTLDIVDQPVPVEWKRSVFNGLGQVLVQSNTRAGEFTLTARAEGLRTATLTVKTEPCSPRPALP